MLDFSEKLEVKECVHLNLIYSTTKLLINIWLIVYILQELHMLHPVPVFLLHLFYQLTYRMDLAVSPFKVTLVWQYQSVKVWQLGVAAQSVMLLQTHLLC